MKLDQVDRQRLLPLLDELTKAIEDLLLTGLTTASESTRNTLNVSFQESSRLGLLRLGGTLRVACEELSRYARNQTDFSRKRFSFFLNRSWLLSRGLAVALKEGNATEFERLSWTPSTVPLKKVQVVTLGVNKKVVQGTFCAFEFRLRSIGTSDIDFPDGERLLWSTMFPIKPGSEIPPEGFLHLPQKQKFNAFHFLEGKIITIENAVISYESSGVGRISLTEQSTVTQGDRFNDWSRFTGWDAQAALTRLTANEPGPLDLDIELQEEVFFEIDKLGEPEVDEAQVFYPIESKGLVFHAVVSKGGDGNSLTEFMKSSLAESTKEPKESEKGSKKKTDKKNEKKSNDNHTNKPSPMLFGLMHYERCRLIVQLLSELGDDGPEHLMLSKEKIDRASLLKALKF